MRILHVYKTYLPESYGGTEQVIRQLCRGTARLGIQSEVLTLTESDGAAEALFEGHVVHLLPRTFEIASTGFALAMIGRMARLAPRFDLIHYHYPWPFMDLVHFAARIRTPSVVSYHADIVRQKNLLKLYRPLQCRFLADVGRIVTTSPNYLASSATLQRYRDKVALITYGLDKALYPPASNALLAHWRRRCGARFFLFVGVLRYYKGLDVLLDAVAGTDYPVVIVGAGPAELALRRQAERLGLTNVQFVGAVSDPDKIALFTLCHAFVFPSNMRTESFGISLLEAAMFGKPMISCEIGSGTSYINLDQKTGLVVAARDHTALRAAMLRLWQDHGLACSMGVEAQARYRETFTAATMSQRYADLYRVVISEKKAASGAPTQQVGKIGVASVPAHNSETLPTIQKNLFDSN